MDWICWNQDRDQKRDLMCAVMNIYNSVKNGDFLVSFTAEWLIGSQE
jgi:hypothetical protein